MAGMTGPLLLLWVGVTVGTMVDLQKRVPGGQPCNQNERQYHVKLATIDPDGSVGFCGGSLVSDRWILTAAHCWQPKRTIYAVVGVHPGPGQKVEIITEPVIYQDAKHKQHDIMLLKLPYPTNIKPVGAPDCTQLANVNKVQIAGHGSTTIGSFQERRKDSTPQLHCADMNIVNCNTFPQHLHNRFADYIDQHLICAQSSGTDACFGDSGGGLVYNNMIYGLLVFGDPDYACKHPTVYMNICTDYLTWIHNTILHG